MSDQGATTAHEQLGTGSSSQDASLERIVELLKAKDDTSRFVGLALLKSTLDSSEQLRNDKFVVTTIWSSISAKFLDRLLRTGSKPGARQADAKEMLDLAANVIYTFAVLLPEDAKAEDKLLGRIPLLVNAIIQSSEETTDFIVKTLLTIVSSSSEGSDALAAVQDWSPLIEIAPKQPLVLSILSWTWINGTHDAKVMSQRIDECISSLCASYKGTDAVTLLDFLGKILGRLNTDLLLERPTWLPAAIAFVHDLARSKPTAMSREAYTNCAANLLVTYGDMASQILFRDIFKSSKSLSYLFVSLILIDLRSSLPNLLAKLNTAEYPAISERLTSALIILSFFINHLLEMIDLAESEDIFQEVQPDLLLKLRDSVMEALSLVLEYLRDRWDAAVSGAQGLHPDARSAEAHTGSGSLKTLAWDSKHESASEDRLLLAALKSLGDWLREDDAPGLRREATGLIDLLMDLYQPSTAARIGLATRPLVLGVLDGILKEDDGVQALLEYNGWSILSQDLILILLNSEKTGRSEHELGQHISAILMALSESKSTTPDDWLDLITGVAAYDVPALSQPPISLQQLWADLLELCISLLMKAPPGVKRRYTHSASALGGIGKVICQKDLEDDIRRQIQSATAQLYDDSILSRSQ
ncbi:hypothetical protein PFICI_12153 [Pestalotiopsis fici W106-1]|uniref:DUF1941 family protein n=1 Tax=Pestalotiopsis fici (strain W106-1 / CGMCC3.15140) TaxID=1229662 RepID=W3WVA0_PESFW|nr:uncharacterized protein PFICI_12153 [Pestalotiopsis fici W106-1]ETS76766.1 hypothetical protein PFICI_12153 [Pestalotiopsis fici W106-1]